MSPVQDTSTSFPICCQSSFHWFGCYGKISVVRLTWPTVSGGFTTMVCASISLLWKSSPETVISCFTKEIVHCLGFVYSHTDTGFAPPSCKDPLNHLSIY